MLFNIRTETLYTDISSYGNSYTSAAVSQQDLGLRMWEEHDSF